MPELQPQGSNTITVAVRATSLFARMWAFHAVCDTLAFMQWRPLDVVLAVAIVGSAAAVAIAPDVVWRFAALSSLFAVQVLSRGPFVPNHWVLACIVDLTIIAAVAMSMMRQRSCHVRLSDAYERFVPAVRVEIVLVYALAGLHKLNWDYLNPAVSCASALTRDISKKLFMTGDIGGSAPIWGSLGFELGLPLLLLSPRSRNLGLGLGLFFHFILGLESNRGIPPFSATIYALYVLFMAPELVDSITRLDWLPRERRSRRAFVGTVLAVSVILGVHFGHPRGLAALLAPGGGFSSWHAVAARILWYAWALLFATAFGVAVRRGRARPFVASLRAPLPLTLFWLLMVVNGSGPYLGFKVVPCFSMFSNLRTEGGKSNHVFLPPAPPGSRAADLVEVVDSSSSLVRRELGKPGFRIPYFELRRRLGGPSGKLASAAAMKDFWITYERRGMLVHVARADDPDHEVLQPQPWLTSKLVAFRKVPPEALSGRCVW